MVCACQCDSTCHNRCPTADAPIKDIHTFVGTFTLHSTSPDPDLEQQQAPQVTPLTAENMLWSNTVLAAGNAIGMVVYTGKETRAVMNTSHPETKVGLLDLEINRVAKVCSPWRRRLVAKMA
jgi:phospholipid-translocating ATPase